jgi:DNA-binding SARP family transcriptional activator
MRLSAFESWCELELASGSYREVIPELEATTSQHPSSEKLNGLLMVGLYYAGRQSDALRVFHDLHRRLAEDQGIAPGPAVCDLELSILDHDPDGVSAFVAPPVRRDPAAPRSLAEAV